MGGHAIVPPDQQSQLPDASVPSVSGSYGYGVDEGANYGKHFAADTYASITRAQWNDYTSRFLPVQRQLIDAVSSPELLNEQLSRIGTNYGSAAGQSQAVQAFRNQRYGVGGSQSGAVGQSATTNAAMTQALSQASAMNATRQDSNDRSQALISGGSTRSTISTGG